MPEIEEVGSLVAPLLESDYAALILSWFICSSATSNNSWALSCSSNTNSLMNLLLALSEPLSPPDGVVLD